MSPTKGKDHFTKLGIKMFSEDTMHTMIPTLNKKSGGMVQTD
jgi:hypothetical protein